jgi:membrane protease YdiL (CAAX protease family)
MPAATSPVDLTTMPGGGADGGWGAAVQVGALFAYLVVSLYVLIRTGFFSSKPLRVAPPRTATALLPIAGGCFVLYVVVTLMALQVGVGTGFLSKRSLDLPGAGGGAATMRGGAATVPEGGAGTMPGGVVEGEGVAGAGGSPGSASQVGATQAVATRGDEGGGARGVGAAGGGLSPVEKMRLDCVDSGSEALAILVVVMLTPLFFTKGVAGLGLDPRKLGWGVLLGLGAYAVLLPWLLTGEIALPMIYSHFFNHTMSVHETLKDIEESPSFDVKLLFALFAGVAAPFSEEVFFRGLLQSAIVQRGWGFWVQVPFPPKDLGYRPSALQRWVAIVVVSVLFAWVHNADHFPILFLLAVGLGYVYERTGNLWATMTMHAAFNWFALVQLLWRTG